MTTDTTALQERVMEALDPHTEIIDVHEGYGAELVVHEHQSVIVTAVLPIIEEEVRAAKAEALREAAPLMHDHHDAAWLETQATEHETGDRA